MRWKSLRKNIWIFVIKNSKFSLNFLYSFYFNWRRKPSFFHNMLYQCWYIHIFCLWLRDMLKNLKRHKDEDILKGQAVKNQKVLFFFIWFHQWPMFSEQLLCHDSAICSCLTIFFNFLLFLGKALWDKTLEFRFLLQKAFSSSNRLPRVHHIAYSCFNSVGLYITFIHCWWHEILVCRSQSGLHSVSQMKESVRRIQTLLHLPRRL